MYTPPGNVRRKSPEFARYATEDAAGETSAAVSGEEGIGAPAVASEEAGSGAARQA